MSKPAHVFIVGCARSGTTAMMRLLNTSKRVCIFNERFSRIVKHEPEAFVPSLFSVERAFDVREGDAFSDQDYLVRQQPVLSAKLAQARLVGDKIPLMHAFIPKVRETFPGAKFVFMLRDIESVANSFEKRADEGRSWRPDRRTAAAVREWNAALRSLKQFHGDDVFVVPYDRFFYGKEGLGELVSFLDGVPDDIDASGTYEAAEAAERNRSEILTVEARVLIAQHAKSGLYRNLQGLARF